MDEQRHERPLHVSPYPTAHLLCYSPPVLGEDQGDDIWSSLTLGLHPTFLFLVQTGKKQGVSENRNKGNLSTHSCAISTCPRSNQTFPGHLSALSITLPAAVAQCLILRTVQRSRGWAQGRTAAPSAVGLRKHMSRILRVWDTDLLFPEH